MPSNPRKMRLGVPDENSQTLIGDLPFGFEISDLEAALEKQRAELRQIEELLSQTDGIEALIRFAKDKKPKLELLLSYSPDQIMQSLRTVYDYVMDLETEGFTSEEILKKMQLERPDLVEVISVLYPIARSQTWGYRIFQQLYALSLRSGRA